MNEEVKATNRRVLDLIRDIRVLRVHEDEGRVHMAKLKEVLEQSKAKRAELAKLITDLGCDSPEARIDLLFRQVLSFVAA